MAFGAQSKRHYQDWCSPVGPLGGGQYPQPAPRQRAEMDTAPAEWVCWGLSFSAMTASRYTGPFPSAQIKSLTQQPEPPPLFIRRGLYCLLAECGAKLNKNFHKTLLIKFLISSMLHARPKVAKWEALIFPFQSLSSFVRRRWKEELWWAPRSAALCERVFPCLESFR